MADKLEALVEQCVSALGLDVEAVELTSGGKRTVLRIAVDADGGVGIDDITAATRALSAELDADDSLMGPAPYTLEVTSRGIDRPLTAPRHWRRNAGRLVRARLLDDSVAEGRIGASDDSGVELGTKASTRRLAYDEIAHAVVQAELNRPPADRSNAGDPADGEDA